MTKPFPDCVRDLWALMDGPNILNLNFNTVLTAVKQLKKSCKAWVQESKPRKLLKIEITFIIVIPF